MIDDCCLDCMAVVAQAGLRMKAVGNSTMTRAVHGSNMRCSTAQSHVTQDRDSACLLSRISVLSREQRRTSVLRSTDMFSIHTQELARGE